MERRLERLPGRAASALLSVVAAASALAIAIPVAHGHLGTAPTAASWCAAQPADGPDGPASEPCSLCLARGHSPAAPTSATARPATPPAARIALPRGASAPAAAPRGPAEARAPPALG